MFPQYDDIDEQAQALTGMMPTIHAAPCKPKILPVYLIHTNPRPFIKVETKPQMCE